MKRYSKVMMISTLMLGLIPIKNDLNIVQAEHRLQLQCQSECISTLFDFICSDHGPSYINSDFCDNFVNKCLQENRTESTLPREQSVEHRVDTSLQPQDDAKESLQPEEPCLKETFEPARSRKKWIKNNYCDHHGCSIDEHRVDTSLQPQDDAKESLQPEQPCLKETFEPTRSRKKWRKNDYCDHHGCNIHEHRVDTSLQSQDDAKESLQPEQSFLKETFEPTRSRKKWKKNDYCDHHGCNIHEHRVDTSLQSQDDAKESLQPEQIAHDRFENKQVEAKFNINPQRNNLIEAAKKYVGTPYKWGSSSNTTASFDCSSFVQRAYKEGIGIKIPRGARQQAAKVEEKGNVQRDWTTLSPGDLMFFTPQKRNNNNQSSSYSIQSINHVGMYIGNGQMIHTYGQGGVTIHAVRGTNWEKKFLFGGSIL